MMSRSGDRTERSEAGERGRHLPARYDRRDRDQRHRILRMRLAVLRSAGGGERESGGRGQVGSVGGWWGEVGFGLRVLGWGVTV